MAKRRTKRIRIDGPKPDCLICGEPSKCRGLCGACYSWEQYHQKEGHGLRYMIDYQARAERLVTRARRHVDNNKKVIAFQRKKAARGKAVTTGAKKRRARG